MSVDPALQPGACFDGQGVHFTLHSSVAERVELCLYDQHGNETARHELTVEADDCWTVYVPGCRPGQHYGYRVHGEYNPDEGKRCNPANLLIDPYTRLLSGSFRWHPAVFDHLPGSGPGHWQINTMDSAPHVARSVVTDNGTPALAGRPRTPWSEAIVYEANVRGFTMRHPQLDEAERGRFRGLSNGRILEYLKALGITTIELQPVHAWIDESFLAENGQSNFWGYNSIGFFAPDLRLALVDPLQEFQDMVNAIHDAGIGVFLDVAYNHTGESDGTGPTLAFRGIDNLAWYRTEPGYPGNYVNDTGTGNTINAGHPRVQQLVLESLAYWHRDMGVDGFRFDLATILGRSAHGFESTHPLLSAIGEDPRLADARMIAEPWDPGPEGYRLGQFPPGWSEWNDRYRDTLRQFWRGDDGHLPELARRLHGSKDLFGDRGALASVNFIASHDGFTLMDVVSYSHRHNEANGQANQDGHAHNLSCNHGVEGESDRPVVVAMRRRHRLNLLASLLFSHGVPMLLAGDEFGNSQGGNNNAYAQDNETGWLAWNGLQDDPEFVQTTRELIALRKQLPIAEMHRGDPESSERNTSRWIHPEGHAMTDDDWAVSRAVLNLLSVTEPSAGPAPRACAIIVNGHDREMRFQLPAPPNGQAWQLAFSSDLSHPAILDSEYRAAAWSIACLIPVEGH